MAYACEFFGWEDDIAGLDVLHAQLALATADGAEHPLHAPVVPVLRRVADAIPLEIVFVAQLLQGAPVARQRRGPIAAGARLVPDSAEAEAGAMVLGFTPDALASGECLALAVVSRSGREFGTVCCKARARTRGVACIDALHSVARMLGMLLEQASTTASVAVWDSSAAAPLGLN
jgi:hypothetical protein